MITGASAEGICSPAGRRFAVDPDQADPTGVLVAAFADLAAPLIADDVRRYYLLHTLLHTALPRLSEALCNLGFRRRSAYGIAAPRRGSSAVAVRIAGAGDLETIARLALVELQHRSSPPMFGPRQDRPLADLIAEHRALREGGAVHFLASLAGHDVGLLIIELTSPVLRLCPGGQPYIGPTATLPGVRGQGVGHALVDAALTWAYDHGYRWVSVDFDTANAKGRPPPGDDRLAYRGDCIQVARRTPMAVAFPGESAEYRAARNRLLSQEIELRRAIEAVAQARRRLPPGGVIPEDYVFQGQGRGGAPARVRLSELFAPGKNSLVIYSMMFPRAADDTSPRPPGGQTALLPLAEGPCPSCTALLDQLDGAAGHVCQHVNLAVVAKAPLERVLTFAAERGWRRLRLLSSAGNTYNRDYLAETADGSQQPMLNVFHRDGETIRHFWGSELFYAPVDPGQEPRHVGTIEPLWNLLDFTPEGRPANWHEQFSY